MEVEGRGSIWCGNQLKIFVELLVLFLEGSELGLLAHWTFWDENKERTKYLGLNGEPGRTRTCNPLIKSQLLYH
jgi:hypothetical protein